MVMVNVVYWLPIGGHVSQASQLGPKIGSHSSVFINALMRAL